MVERTLKRFVYPLDLQVTAVKEAWSSRLGDGTHWAV